MTQQYLAGELSLLLARLQAVATDQASARHIACLRREAETGPLTALSSLTARALALTDALNCGTLASVPVYSKRMISSDAAAPTRGVARVGARTPQAVPGGGPPRPRSHSARLEPVTRPDRTP